MPYKQAQGWGISIHAPRGGSDTHKVYLPSKFLFQSTLPVGGATLRLAVITQMYYISIHAPRGGSDMLVMRLSLMSFLFQSTLPVGGATVPILPLLIILKISIHAPRGGSDS